MKIYDVSVEIKRGMHVFPGDPRFRSKQVKAIETDSYELHKLMMGNHTGTHVDAPGHFLKDGMRIDELPLEIMNGRARVVEIHNNSKIDIPELERLVLVDDFRILFKTRNSLIWKSRKKFRKDYIYLTEDGANYLTESGIKLIGFDYLSIDQYGNDSHPAHKVLLGNGVILVEGLNLSEVDEGNYELCCLPLRLTGLDAAPARVILKK
jgi:arylformamidase